MAELNGITVRFSDGIKTADYAPPRLYDITANVVLGPNDNFEKVMADTMTAIQRAGYAALHGKKLDMPEPAATEPKEEASGEAPPRRGRGRPKKEEATSEPEQPQEPAAEPEPVAEPEAEPPVVTNDDWESAPADIEVTDQELLSSLSKRAAELGNRDPCIKLIATFATRTEGPPFKVQEIPQAQRKDFLAKLAALTA